MYSFIYFIIIYFKWIIRFVDDIAIFLAIFNYLALKNSIMYIAYFSFFLT